jgi:hypothetical protein
MRDWLAMMLTMTTYGAPLTEEERGWVEEDLILPAGPVRQLDEGAGRLRGPLTLPREQLPALGERLGAALRGQLGLRVWAMTLQTWYLHLLVGATNQSAAKIVACVEDTFERSLTLKPPIWEPGYDKRYCFDAETVRERMTYIERHNVVLGWPARPWPFIEAVEPS